MERLPLTEDRICQSQFPLVQGSESGLVNTYVRTQIEMKLKSKDVEILIILETGEGSY